MAIYKLYSESWCILAKFKDGTCSQVAGAYRRACDACQDAKRWFEDLRKGRCHCGFRQDEIDDFIVCKRTESQVWSVKLGVR